VFFLPTNVLRSYIIITTLFVSLSSAAQRKYPVTELRHGHVVLKTGRLKIDSVYVYDSLGLQLQALRFDAETEIQLASSFQKAGHYTLIFILRNKKRIRRNLIVL
jgi:hypothetical protein